MKVKYISFTLALLLLCFTNEAIAGVVKFRIGYVEIKRVDNCVKYKLSNYNEDNKDLFSIKYSCDAIIDKDKKIDFDYIVNHETLKDCGKPDTIFNGKKINDCILKKFPKIIIDPTLVTQPKVPEFKHTHGPVYE